MDILRNTLDLNFLRIFDALMQEKSVVGAAAQLGVTASAVSHALAKMREQFEDDLFVRTADGMRPTLRAEAMYVHAREALLHIRLAVSTSKFVPATSNRTLTVAANDHVTAVLLPDVIRRVSELAPNLNVVVRPSTRIDLVKQIDHGHIDLAIAVFESVPKRLGVEPLFRDRDTLIVSDTHPLAHTEPTIEQLALYPLAVVSLGSVEGETDESVVSERGLVRQSEMFDAVAVRDGFASMNLEPRIPLIVPHFLALPDFLDGSDFVAIVPASLARRMVRVRNLVELRSPLASKIVTMSAVWHHRSDADDALGWLRGIVKSCASGEF
tara:strand:+ start:1532 stop:2506 length:975 start_codon:yes stop_codon:yes gene_type:complete